MVYTNTIIKYKKKREEIGYIIYNKPKGLIIDLI